MVQDNLVLFKILFTVMRMLVEGPMQSICFYYNFTNVNLNNTAFGSMLVVKVFTE